MCCSSRGRSPVGWITVPTSMPGVNLPKTIVASRPHPTWDKKLNVWGKESNLTPVFDVCDGQRLVATAPCCDKICEIIFHSHFPLSSSVHCCQYEFQVGPLSCQRSRNCRWISCDLLWSTWTPVRAAWLHNSCFVANVGFRLCALRWMYLISLQI